MVNNTEKYMCIVETKNYPITTIFPVIQRYSRIKKKLTVTEIACCLAAYATGSLVKQNDAIVKLNKDNFKSVILAYKSELQDLKINQTMAIEDRKNSQRIEELKKEFNEPTKVSSLSYSDAETQPDPEDPDIFDETPFYTTDDE